MFQKLKVSTRLFMGFGIVISIMVGIVLTGVSQMQIMDHATANLIRASTNSENGLRLLDGVNSMRRFQLSALASSGTDRTHELERVDAMGVSLIKRADEYARENQISGEYGSYEELLNDPDVEVVYI